MSEIIISPEHLEHVDLNQEPFMLADSQTKTVALNMASGDQVILPDAGKVLSQVVILKPDTLAEENIRENVNIGGKVGTFAGTVLEPLSNPAYEAYVWHGKEYYDDQGVRRVGTHSHPTLTNPAGAGQIFAGYDAINDDNYRVAGTFALPSSSESADANQVVLGKKFVGWSGEITTGTMKPNEWDNDFLNIYWQEVVVDTTEASTGAGVRDYLYGKLGLTVTNRLIGFGLRKPTTYAENEIVRYAIYPNSNHCTIAKYSNGSFVSGSLSGSAPLLAGRVYDVYYWLGHNPGEEPTR